jgi:crotonobetainyl-CoA:carnitine CoA-transferase CaiB-like acyl-CoA transferase
LSPEPAAGFDGYRAEPQRPPPLLGQHTDEMFTGLGYTPTHIESVRKDGEI